MYVHYYFVRRRASVPLQCVAFTFKIRFWNKYWKQQSTKQQQYGHLSSISKTIQIRRARHMGHTWRSKDGLISDVVLWTPSHGRTSVGRPARTKLQQLYMDTGCNLVDMLSAMDDRNERRDSFKGTYASSSWYYLPTPPLGQDMTQGQFLSGV